MGRGDAGGRGRSLGRGGRDGGGRGEARGGAFEWAKRATRRTDPGRLDRVRRGRKSQTMGGGRLTAK